MSVLIELSLQILQQQHEYKNMAKIAVEFWSYIFNENGISEYQNLKPNEPILTIHYPFET